MEQIICLVVGIIFVVSGALLAKAAYNTDLQNTFEAVFFGLAVIFAGIVLCYIGVFGPPG